MSRVVIVRLRGNRIVKVCDGRDAYDHWLETYCQYDGDNLTTTSAAVYQKD